MDYYSRRKSVINVIDKMHEQGIKLNKIIYHIEKTYGFPAKIVKNRIEILENMENGQEL